MRLVCLDMVRRLPELSHVDLSRVAVSFVQTRKSVQHGIQASLMPMRFKGGSLTTTLDGIPHTFQRLFHESGVEILYIIRFYLPRFLNQSLSEKLATTLHELWHISPSFNGDLRRYAGRYYAHGPSEAAFDAVVKSLVQKWLFFKPPPQVYRFLRSNFGQLSREYGRVYGLTIPAPLMMPLSSSSPVR